MLTLLARINLNDIDITPAGALIILGATLVGLPLLLMFSEWIKRTKARNNLSTLAGTTVRPKPIKPKADLPPRQTAPPPPPAPQSPPPLPVYVTRPIAPPPAPPKPVEVKVDAPVMEKPAPEPGAAPAGAAGEGHAEPAGRSVPAVVTPPPAAAPAPEPVAAPKPPTWWIQQGGAPAATAPAQPTAGAERVLQQMQIRKLGRTGYQVSEIGMGTWGMGGMWGPMNDREAIRSIHRAIDLGVNFIDTALAYGNGHAEELIGGALKQRSEAVYVATKVPPKNMQWPARHDVPAAEAFPETWIIACAEVSLRHLQRQRIDLLQLHVWAPRWLHERDVWLPAIERLKKDGKIRAFGLSINDCEPDTAIEAVATGLVDSVQVIYNIFEQAPAERLFPACQQHDVGVIVRCPLDEGSLSGVLTSDTVFHPDDWRRNYFAGERLQQTVDRVGKLQFLVQDGISTLAHGALKFCLAHPAVSTVIPGMRRVLHVQENCLVSDGRPLSPKVLQQLKDHAWPRNFYTST